MIQPADIDRVRGIAHDVRLTLAKAAGTGGRYYLINSRDKVVHSAGSLKQVERFLHMWTQHVR